MPQESQSDLGPVLGILLIMLLAVVLFAWRRSKGTGDGIPPRLMRIVFTAVGFGGAFTLMLVTELIWRSSPIEQLLQYSLISLAASTASGFVLFAIAEFWLGLMQPSRIRYWLFAAILAFAGLLLVAIAFIFWLKGILEQFNYPGMMPMIGLATIAAILWWSYLPPPRADVAQRFE